MTKGDEAQHEGLVVDMASNQLKQLADQRQQIDEAIDELQSLHDDTLAALDGR